MPLHVVHVLCLELTLITLILIALIVLQMNVLLQVELTLGRMVTLITLVGLVTSMLVKDMLTQLVAISARHIAHGTLDLVYVLAGVLF